MIQVFRNIPIREYLQDIVDYGAVSIPDFLLPIVRLQLLAELERYNMKEEPQEYGKHRVKQAFTSLSEFPQRSYFHKVRDELMDYLALEFQVYNPEYIAYPLQFNSLVVQRYEPGPIGISPHRDGKSFINLIAIFVLEGKGRFCVCKDREGNGALSIRNEPGDLLLMRGPEFLGSDEQPFHFVDQVTERRTTFALRHKVET